MLGTNLDYLNAFNEYLETNNLTQAKTDGMLLAGQQIVPINYDMFFGFLIDKVVLQVVNTHSFIDKLDVLYSGTLDLGAIVEDDVSIIKSKLFDYDTKVFETDVQNPYKKHKKGLSVVFHTISDYRKITVTLSYQQIKTGCLTEGGVDRIVQLMINDVYVEYSGWAYAKKKDALANLDYAQVRYFEDYKDFNIQLKGVKIDVTNYDNSYKHNASLLLTPTTESNLIIIMSEKFKNEVDVNVFTGLFNVSYAELKDKILYIDEFNDPEIVCGIFDRRGIFFKRVLDTERELENGADLTRNYWKHFWRMHSTSPHFTAVVFKQVKDGFYNDVAMLVQGYDDTQEGENKFIETATITAPDTAGTYSIDNKEAQTYTAGQEITITNTPHKLAPYKVVFKNTAGEIISTYRVRFEYPSEIDATFGHPRLVDGQIVNAG